MPKKRLPSPEHADTLSLNALRSLVTGLVSEVTKLRAENAELREENAALHQEDTRLKVENQLLRDEIARLKNLSPRPPFRPSGMEKATEFKQDDAPAAKKKPRGPKLDTKRVSREEVLRLCVPPAGSRFKGYKSCHVRDLVISAEIVHYRRECWLTPEGKMLLAPLPARIVGSYGANLRRFCLMLHAQGQVTIVSTGAILPIVLPHVILLPFASSRMLLRSAA
ncbi:cell division protein ZapB [Ensifer sp. NPDC090286]|uniref:cell division protein ZapB n=1 Tax=Ensifer sp. NPDC090286 TaxID=3363991 RepID=UPI00383A5234